MSADELREILNKKDESEELRTMRMRVAELVTENAMLKAKAEQEAKEKGEYEKAEEELLRFINRPTQIKFRWFRL